MIDLLKYPDFLLIRAANKIGKFDKVDKELQSRCPESFIEYDADGNVITGEVIGYTDEGKEIWIR